MNLKELQAKPLVIGVENNINADILLISETIQSLVDKISEKLNVVEAYLNFLIILQREDGKFVTAITFKQLRDLVEQLKSERDWKKNISSLDYIKTMRYDFVVNRDESTIGDVMRLFSKDDTDIVVVLSGDGRYIGKIKRNNFAKLLKEWVF